MTPARHLRFTRALLGQHGVVVVAVDSPVERQGLISYKSLKSVAASPMLARAICEQPHKWVIYLAIFCCDSSGTRYVKSEEIAPQGQYKSDRLADVMESHHNALAARCNPAHIVGKGWIASPTGVSLTEEQADRIFDAVDAWGLTDRDDVA